MGDLALIKIIEEDDSVFFEDELNEGLNVNELVNQVPILLYAISASAENIAQLLIRKGANVNAMFEINGEKYSALYLAMESKQISKETIKLLLEHGANINFISLVKIGNVLNHKLIKRSLFSALILANEEKEQFVIDYLIIHYGKDVITIALSQADSLYVIKKLIANGAVIPENIIDIAKQLKKDKKTINFLQRQFEINKTIVKTVKCFPYEIADLINAYSRGPEQSLQHLLIEAITYKDIIFIKNYIKNGGNPNYIIKREKTTWSLLMFAICNSAEEIATYLIENGANINIKSKRKKEYYSPLQIAFVNENISLNFIEKILFNGANINSVFEVKNKFKTHCYNLAGLLLSEEINDKKKWWLFEFLLKRFGENVLDFVLESKISLEIIKTFIDEGNAKVTQHLVEKAMKLGHSKEIIDYLKSFLQLSEQLSISNIQLPEYPKILINDYCIEETGNKPEKSKKCIIC